jgi:hypothetical protein
MLVGVTYVEIDEKELEEQRIYSRTRNAGTTIVLVEEEAKQPQTANQSQPGGDFPVAGISRHCDWLGKHGKCCADHGLPVKSVKNFKTVFQVLPLQTRCMVGNSYAYCSFKTQYRRKFFPPMVHANLCSSISFPCGFHRPTFFCIAKASASITKPLATTISAQITLDLGLCFFFESQTVPLHCPTLL